MTVKYSVNLLIDRLDIVCQETESSDINNKSKLKQFLWI